MDTDTDIRMSLEASLRLLVEEQLTGRNTTPEQIDAQTQRIYARLTSADVCDTIRKGGEVISRGEGFVVREGESLADAFFRVRPGDQAKPK